MSSIQDVFDFRGQVEKNLPMFSSSGTEAHIAYTEKLFSDLFQTIQSDLSPELKKNPEPKLCNNSIHLKPEAERLFAELKEYVKNRKWI